MKSCWGESLQEDDWKHESQLERVLWRSPGGTARNVLSPESWLNIYLFYHLDAATSAATHLQDFREISSSQTWAKTKSLTFQTKTRGSFPVMSLDKTMTVLYLILHWIVPSLHLYVIGNNLSQGSRPGEVRTWCGPLQTRDEVNWPLLLRRPIPLPLVCMNHNLHTNTSNYTLQAHKYQNYHLQVKHCNPK